MITFRQDHNYYKSEAFALIPGNHHVILKAAGRTIMNDSGELSLEEADKAVSNMLNSPHKYIYPCKVTMSWLDYYTGRLLKLVNYIKENGGSLRYG